MFSRLLSAVYLSTVSLFLSFTLTTGKTYASSGWPKTVGVHKIPGDYDHLKIRVKVFPHRRDFNPHRRDDSRDYVEIKSDEKCRIYKGQKNKTGKTRSSFILESHIKLHTIHLKDPLWVECDKPATIVRKGKELVNYKYAGSFYVFRQPAKQSSKFELVVVNVVDMETYLRGVVPSEVYTNWPMETLKSQSVAARTYAMFHLTVSRRDNRKNSQHYFDVDDTILYQAYTGLTHIHDRTDQAIRETRSLVLTHNNGIIQAYYHADSGGGKTESAQSVWGVDVPYCLAKKEPYTTQRATTINWKTKISKGELSRRLSRFGLIGKSEIIHYIAPLKNTMTRTGRVKTLLVKTTSGTHHKISTKQFKRYINLNSNKFSIEASKTHLYFVGRGFGHGVGMNQKGAQVLARQKGWNFKKILGHYYTQTKICALKSTDNGSPVCG